jgi:hypothetical protein
MVNLCFGVNSYEPNSLLLFFLVLHDLLLYLQDETEKW